MSKKPKFTQESWKEDPYRTKIVKLPDGSYEGSIPRCPRAGSVKMKTKKEVKQILDHWTETHYFCGERDLWPYGCGEFHKKENGCPWYEGSI